MYRLINIIIFARTYYDDLFKMNHKILKIKFISKKWLK